MKCMSYFLHMLVLKNVYGFMRFYSLYKKCVTKSPFTILWIGHIDFFDYLLFLLVDYFTTIFDSFYKHLYSKMKDLNAFLVICWHLFPEECRPHLFFFFLFNREASLKRSYERLFVVVVLVIRHPGTHSGKSF